MIICANTFIVMSLNYVAKLIIIRYTNTSIPFISNTHASLSCRILLESSNFILRVPL